MIPSELPRYWAARAAELAPYAPAAAAAFRQAGAELQNALDAAADEALTLTEAARESGYAARTLRQKVAEGEIPNAGKKGSPRIRRGDLPRRARATSGGWDPRDHVAGIVGGAT